MVKRQIDTADLFESADSEDKKTLELTALKVTQPIGQFFIATIGYKQLLQICDFDIRELAKGETIEEYIGIQRKLRGSRVNQISEFIQLPDSSFPTSVIVSIDNEFMHIDPDNEEADIVTLTISNKSFEGSESKHYRSLARVLDGQHRLKGLEKSGIDNFELNVTIFVGMDLPDQSMIFANVNLSQTKVNPSLAYDLQELSKYHSPLRFSHRVVVTLNSIENSPFRRLIKRLGTKTPGVEGETLSQATFVEKIVDLITPKSRLMEDIKYGKESTESWFSKKPPIIEDPEGKLILRDFYTNIDRGEAEAASLLINYFQAIKERWADVWENEDEGVVIKRNNGFRAFMRLLPLVYRKLSNVPGEILPKEKFLTLFNEIKILDNTFKTDKAKPGSGGEALIFNTLKEKLDELK
jgi:DGQHR domain-containing protein